MNLKIALNLVETTVFTFLRDLRYLTMTLIFKCETKI